MRTTRSSLPPVRSAASQVIRNIGLNGPHLSSLRFGWLCFMERQRANMPKETKPEFLVPLKIVLVDPLPGVDFGIQEGKGNDYKTISVQRSKPCNLMLECTIKVKGSRTDGPPNFAGPISQGPPGGRFIYIDIGKSAGQVDSCWQRRIKLPLDGITWDMIDSVLEKPKRLLQATIPGTGRDGGPSCATVKPIEGWMVAKA